MLVSGFLVIVCAIINLADTVAIFTGVIGTQEGSDLTVIALFFGLVAIAIFAFAYKRAIWNWTIRVSMIAVGIIIFLVSIASLTENWNSKTDLGDIFRWNDFGEVVREVSNPIWWVDIDAIILLMFLGSIGILATAIWGAFRWERVKSNERTENQMRTVLNELPPTAFSPEANLRYELEQHFQAAPRPSPGIGQHSPSVQPGQAADEQGSPPPSQITPASPQSASTHAPGFGGRGRRCPRCYQPVDPGTRVCLNCGGGG